MSWHLPWGVCSPRGEQALALPAPQGRGVSQRSGSSELDRLPPDL